MLNSKQKRSISLKKYLNKFLKLKMMVCMIKNQTMISNHYGRTKLVKYHVHTRIAHILSIQKLKVPI